MTPKHSQFTTAQRFEAELVLEGMSDTDRVHFALKLMLEIEDHRAIGALSFAGRQISNYANILTSAAFNAECG